MSWDAWIGHNECHEEPTLEIEEPTILADPNTFDPFILVRVKIKLTPEMQALGMSYCQTYARKLIEKLK